MTFEFDNNKLKKQFADATAMKKAFGVLAKKMSDRMDEIRTSPSLAVLRQIPAANCHKLTGKRKDQWAVTISGNYRIIFELDHEPLPMANETEIDFASINRIKIIEVIDYH